MAIGHLINILTPEEEDRLLTNKLGCYKDGECLLQNISGTRWPMENTNSRHFRDAKHSLYAYPVLHEKYAPAQRGWDYKRIPTWWYHSTGARYDALVERWGVIIVARAIRNRVMSNQARRVLKQDEAPVCA
jgi:hypothetical protein